MKRSDHAFRILFSLIFIVSASTHLLNPAQISKRLLAAPGADLVPAWLPVDGLVMGTDLVLLLGGLGLLLNIQARKAA